VGPRGGKSYGPGRYQNYIKPIRDRRAYWIDKYKMGKGCEICGYNKHSAALHFDHLDRETKIGYIKMMITHSLKRLVNEMRKCRILCANCHAEHTSDNQHWKRKESTPPDTRVVDMEHKRKYLREYYRKNISKKDWTELDG